MRNDELETRDGAVTRHTERRTKEWERDGPGERENMEMEGKKVWKW